MGEVITGNVGYVKSTERALVLYAFLLVLLVPVGGWAQTPGGFVPGEVIVKMKSQQSNAGANTASSFIGKAHSRRQMVLKSAWDQLHMYHFTLRAGQDVEAGIEELRNDPDVEYVEPNYYVSKTQGPPIPGLQQTYSESQVQALSNSAFTVSDPMTGAPINGVQVWQYEQASSSTVVPIVAVVDTGIDTTHPVFVNSGAVWTNTGEIAGNHVDDDHNGYVDDVHGWNFVANSGSMYDDDGHGTHVSGIILGVGQNIYSSGQMTSALVKIMPLKFLDSHGVGTTSAAINAIYYAMHNGASIVNNSWGGPSYSQALNEAVAATYNDGMVFVAAAGNSAQNNDIINMYPANYTAPSLISVAATDDNDMLASFSNYGVQTVHIGSPGVYMLSTLPGGYYGSMSGTSMAAPFISGVAAMMMRDSPNMLGYQLKTLMMAQVDQISHLNGIVTSGGRVNTLNAISAAKYATVSSSQPSYDYMSASSRSPAGQGQAAAAGCGVVKKLANDFSDQNKRPPRGPGAYSIPTLLILITAPLIVLIGLRLRAGNGKELRRYERFHLDSAVRVRVGDQELVGSVSTISVGGAQINTEALLEKGGIVSMTISSPDGKEQIQVAGEIVWSAARKSYGVAFNDATLATLNRIETWSKSLQKA